MGNVVPFPIEKARKTGKPGELQTKMSNLAQMLDARYEHLHELTQAIETITKECEKFESQYEILLQAYAERVGPANVEMKFYDYSSEVDIAFDADFGTFMIEGVDRTTDHRNHIETESPPPGVA